MNAKKIRGYIIALIGLAGLIVSMVFFFMSRTFEDYGDYGAETSYNKDAAAGMIGSVFFLVDGLYVLYSAYKNVHVVGLEGVIIAVFGGVMFAYCFKQILDDAEPNTGYAYAYGILMALGLLIAAFGGYLAFKDKEKSAK